MSIRFRWILPAVLCLVAGLALWTPRVSAQYGGVIPYSAGYDPVSGQRVATAELIRASGQSIQSLGLGLEAQSRALINYEQARGQYIENAGRWTDVYNQRRRQQLELEAYERERSRAELQQYLQNRPQPEPPQTLSPAELNPTNGHIEWPAVLLSEEYASLRDAIEKEFVTLAQTSGAAGNTRMVRELAEQMRGILRAHIQDMPSYEYIAARKFIDELANSAVAL
jgi:hypothetical protein